MTRLPPVAQTRVLRDRRRSLLLLSSVFLVLAMLAATARGARADEAQEAADFVRGFGAQAVAMLSDQTLDDGARVQQFRRLLRAEFHLEAISRFVLGRYWRRASPPERAEFARLFEDYLVASYARQLSQYGGERLVVEGGRAKGGQGAIVSSRIVRPEGEPYQVDWRLRRGAEGWRIIDVVVEGVSMAVTQRSEISSVIAGQGGSVAGLLDVLRSKTAPAETNLAAGSDEQG